MSPVSSGDSFSLHHSPLCYDEETLKDLREISTLKRDTSLELDFDEFRIHLEDCLRKSLIESQESVAMSQILNDSNIEWQKSLKNGSQNYSQIETLKDLQFESLNDFHEDLQQSYERSEPFNIPESNTDGQEKERIVTNDQLHLEDFNSAEDDKKETLLTEIQHNIVTYIKSQLLQTENEIFEKVNDFESKFDDSKTTDSESSVLKEYSNEYKNLQNYMFTDTTKNNNQSYESFKSEIAPSENNDNDISNLASENINNLSLEKNDFENNANEMKEEAENINKNDENNLKTAKLLEDDGRRFYMSDACLSHSRTRFTEVFESHFDANIYLNTHHENEYMNSDEVVDIRIESHIPGLNAQEYVINMPKLVIRTLPFSINIIHNEDFTKSERKCEIEDEDDTENNIEKDRDITKDKKVASPTGRSFPKAKHPTAFIKNTYAVTFTDSLEEDRPSSVDSQTQTHIDMINYDKFKKSRTKDHSNSDQVSVVSICTQTSDVESSSSSEIMFPNLQRDDDIRTSTCSSYEFVDLFINKTYNNNDTAKQIDQCMTTDKEIKDVVLLPSISCDENIYEDIHHTSIASDNDSEFDYVGENISNIGKESMEDYDNFSEKSEVTDNETNELNRLQESSDSVFINDSGIEQSYDFSIYEENLGTDTDFELEELMSYDEDISPLESESSFHFDSASLSNSPIDTISDYENDTEEDHLTIEPPTISVSEQYLSTLKVVSTLFASTFSLINKEKGFRRAKEGKYSFEIELENKIKNLRNSNYQLIRNENKRKRVSFSNFVKYNFVSKEGKLICYSTNGENGEECRPFAVYISEEIFV